MHRVGIGSDQCLVGSAPKERLSAGLCCETKNSINQQVQLPRKGKWWKSCKLVVSLFKALFFRMRAKTSDFLKVLNRAKIEDESVKKKISHQWGNKS